MPAPQTAPLIRQRLANQSLTGPLAAGPGELVRWFGAVQAQDLAGAIWALGQRLPAETTEADVERAIADREIVRTWPMRRTLHFVPAEDAAWMIRLLASRMVRGSWGRYRALGLDEAAMRRSARILERALSGTTLTRPETYAALAEGGVDPGGQRGIHLLSHHAQEGLLCIGPRRERQPTFALLEEWVPVRRDLAGDEALAVLAERYFRSHGPASLRDFAWWASLPLRDAKRAIAAAGPRLESVGEDTWIVTDPPPAPRSRNRAALLPPWDEYLVAYKDRSAATGHLRGERANPLRILGSPLVVLDGIVRGTWRRQRTARGVRLSFDLWGRIDRGQRQAVEDAAQRYGRFIDQDVETGKAR